MHYYKLNIPDWNLSTSHLTLEEEAIYFRLVNHYYDTEQPFSDLDMVFRRLRMVKQSAQALLILREFFFEQNGEWHHLRCDKELDDYAAKSLKNNENGKRGGRPKKPKENPVGFSQEPKENPDVTLTTNHKPLTINQEPETKRKNTRVFSIDAMLEIGPELAMEFMRHRKAVKAPLSAIAWDQFVKEAGKAGWTVEEAVRECIGRGWKSFKAEWVTAKTVVAHEYQMNPFSDNAIEGECYESE
jgi:uncharacterized protein YdaU (DUF1376 family)